MIKAYRLVSRRHLLMIKDMAVEAVLSKPLSRRPIPCHQGLINFARGHQQSMGMSGGLLIAIH
jgi:hypothetical protein